MAKAPEAIATVRIEQVRSFWRFNRYTRRNELQYCISMSHVGDGDDGGDAELPWLVTFTSGQFARVAEENEGREITIAYCHKRYQEYNGKQQEAVNYVRVV